MCRNHSHLTAALLGEDTAGALPVLTFLLQQKLLSIETPGSGGLKIQTSGLLYVPSFVLAGSLASPLHPMEAQSMSLFFMPDDALTGILGVAGSFLILPETLPSPSMVGETYPLNNPLANEPGDEDDDPF